MRKPLVYLASPYTMGDPAINTHCQCRAFDRLMGDGIVWPVAPLLSHLQHLLFPRPYQDWIEYDLALLERCDALLRLDAVMPEVGYSQSESSGADGEVAAMLRLGRPVFYGVTEVYTWANRHSLTEPSGYDAGNTGGTT